VRLAGIYSNPIIVSGYGYNLLIDPFSDADIRIRISAEGDIRNQNQRISAYLYPTTAQNPYPDNPWYIHTEGQMKSRCMQGLGWDIRADVREHSTGNM